MLPEPFVFNKNKKFFQYHQYTYLDGTDYVFASRAGERIINQLYQHKSPGGSVTDHKRHLFFNKYNVIQLITEVIDKKYIYM